MSKHELYQDTKRSEEECMKLFRCHFEQDFAGQSVDSQEFSIRHIQENCCYVTVVVQGRNNMWELAVCAAEEPLWMCEKTLPLTPEEREIDADGQKRNNHGYTC